MQSSHRTWFLRCRRCLPVSLLAPAPVPALPPLPFPARPLPQPPPLPLPPPPYCFPARCLRLDADAQHHLDLGTCTTTRPLSITLNSAVSKASVLTPAGAAAVATASSSMPRGSSNNTLTNCSAKCLSSNIDVAAPVAAYIVNGCVLVMFRSSGNYFISATVITRRRSHRQDHR
ncbi:hypothetical protein GQ55_4G078100 [Panicum hallii var. hallii]|uniref:Uncharacterized protein n=1 Tax=Panicum hallii var. hallii TaxID=1504633 RepID=A0A2T7DWC7_9POAL|nr:hypothetical protein GQ55_4G078100 [Panicum hallii var. hallii]